MPQSLIMAVYELIQKVEEGKKILRDFPAHNDETIREAALRHCLVRAIDLAEGGVLATEKRLPETLSSTNRSLYETFIRIRWVSLSDENAEQFREAGRNFLGKSLRKGFGALTPSLEAAQSAEQVELAVKIAEEAAEHFKNVTIPQSTAWDRMAQDGGLERMHTSLYDWLSICGHGTTFGFSEDVATTEDKIFAHIACAISLTRAVNATFKNWMLYKHLMTVDEVENILEYHKNA